jgi:hypothetical protein
MHSREVASAEVDRRAVLARSGQFRERGALRHEDRRRQARQLRAERDTLGVVSRRGGDDLGELAASAIWRIRL